MKAKTPAAIVNEGRMPTTEELQAFYNELATPREHDGWFGSTLHIDEGFGRVQFALGHIEPEMSVLEAGCADGGVSRHLLKRVGPNGHLTLVDISSAYVDRAAMALSDMVGEDEAFDDTVDFHDGDAAAFNTRRRYDVIVAMEIMEHVPDPRALLGNLMRLLRKAGGKVLITVPHDIDDALGEHIHQFTPQDIAVIVGEVTGRHVPVRLEGNTVFAVIDTAEEIVPYVP